MHILFCKMLEHVCFHFGEKDPHMFKNMGNIVVEFASFFASLWIHSLVSLHILSIVFKVLCQELLIVLIHLVIAL